MSERTADLKKCFENINTLNELFDNCKPTVERNKKVVERFLSDLQRYSSAESFIRKSEFIGIGSSYENTAINWWTDFDIAMILPSPFSTEYFKCIQLENPGLYKLQLIGNQSLRSQFTMLNFSNLLNPSNHLLVGALRDQIFSELSLALQNPIFEDYTVEFNRLASSFCIKLKKGRFFIKIDVVPQIKAKTKDIPGWKGENLPGVIDNFISNNDMHILCNLSSPPNFKNRNVRHLVVQPSLNLLEKEVMLDSATLRYSVCIAKTVYKHYKWASKGLRSFHVKRVALNLHSAIKLRESSWIGYLLIMQEIIKMLKSGTIDGCFIEGQNLICIDKFKCQELAVEVEEAYNTTYPDNILQFLEPLGKISSASLEPRQFLNIPSFHQNNAPFWFKRLETELSAHDIYCNDSRFYFAFHFLSQEIRMKIPASVITQHSYPSLMYSVLILCGTSNSTNLNQRFIDATEITDSLPLYIRTSQRSSTDVADQRRVKGDTNSGLLIPDRILNIDASTSTTSRSLANRNHLDNAATNISSTTSRSLANRNHLDNTATNISSTTSRSLANRNHLDNAATNISSTTSGSLANRNHLENAATNISSTTSRSLANRNQLDNAATNISSRSIQNWDSNLYENYANASSRSVLRPDQYQINNVSTSRSSSGSLPNKHQYQPSVNVDIAYTTPQCPSHVVNITTDHTTSPTPPQSTNIRSVFSEALSGIATRCRKFFRDFGKCIVCQRENNIN